MQRWTRAGVFPERTPRSYPHSVDAYVRCVIGHDNETVELEAAFIAMLEERGDEEFGVGYSLEVAMLLEGSRS